MCIRWIAAVVLGAFVVCPVVAQAQTGACCLASAPWCDDTMTEAECVTAGGSYQGDGTTCEFSEDCNGNEVPDMCDIANGTSVDCNNNGIPDECELLVADLYAVGSHRCFSPVLPGPACRLFRIGPSNGSCTLVGVMGALNVAEGLSVHPTTAQLYGIGAPYLGEYELFIVDPETADVQFIGPLGPSGASLSDVAFREDGTLYGILDTGDIVTIDIATGAINPGTVCTLSYGEYHSIAFEPATGLLYHTYDDYSMTWIEAVDLDDACAVVSTSGACNAVYPAFGCVAFHPAVGQFFGSWFDESDVSPDLYDLSSPTCDLIGSCESDDALCFEMTGMAFVPRDNDKNDNGLLDECEHLCDAAPCPGDTNLDGLLNGLDIQAFVQVLLDGPLFGDPDFCCVDVNKDLSLNELDIQEFVQMLLDGDECPPRCAECPPDPDIDENDYEPCGEDTNGGCDSDPYNPPAIDLGELGATCDLTVCGTITQDDLATNTDWYKFTSDGSGAVTVTLTAQFPVAFGFVETDPRGSDDCYARTGEIYPRTEADACQEASVTMSCLLACQGSYWIYVAPQPWFQVECGGNCQCGEHYVFTVTCQACLTGACCHYDGACDDTVLESECAAIPDSYWWGPGTHCDDPNVFCSGACCHYDPAETTKCFVCDETLTENDCYMTYWYDPHWSGPATTCDVLAPAPSEQCNEDFGVWDLRPCCVQSGIGCDWCVEDTTCYECEVELGGTWDPTPGWLGCYVGSCAELGGDCGACCDDDTQTCSEEYPTDTDCYNAGGDAWYPQAHCINNPCGY